MSSHREAPEISKDPVADNTDTYAFVSPDKPTRSRSSRTTCRCEAPAGGPNFFEFGDDVLYSIYIDNDGDGAAGDHLRVPLRDRRCANPNTFLYNTGPINSLDDPNWNRRQFYTRHARRRAERTVLGGGPRLPALQHRPALDARTTRRSARRRCTRLPAGSKVFAGQRNDPFYVDLGSIFDLGDLRPFQNLHLIPTAAAPGVDAMQTLNVHTIAIQVPIGD